jgi:hypothetical protein
MVTTVGEQGVEMIMVANPKTAIPLHYDDCDVFKSPLSDFKDTVRVVGLEHRAH